MATDRDNVDLGNIRGRDESPTRKLNLGSKPKRIGTSKMRDPTIASTSEVPPPQQVSHGVDGGLVALPLEIRANLIEAGLTALKQRLEVAEGNFCSLESTALEELGDVKETLDRLTDEHKDGLTNLELKLTEVVSALHGEVEALKQQLKAVRLAGGTEHVTVRETKIQGPKPKEFRGERNAQDVENFLWKMEDYFEHLNIVLEAAKVRAATISNKGSFSLSNYKISQAHSPRSLRTWNNEILQTPSETKQ